jgi:DNA-binding NtrC family response regulator/pSer/pThr/pTyr-binding forkhead associated (FHA) protein
MHRFNQAPPPSSKRREAETEGTREPQREEAARALYVTSPSGGSRFILPEGFVRLGRSGDCSIVVDDPRVSRSHAALHVATDVKLTDLGSANGTFVDEQRILPGSARQLAPGHAFFIGDSVLVVRATTLRKRCPQRVSTFEQARERVANSSTLLDTNAQLIVLKVRLLRPTQTTVLEPILGELLQSATDWMLFVGADLVFLGLTVNSPAQSIGLERRTLSQLISWSVVADVQSRLLKPDAILSGGHELTQLFDTNAALTLDRAKIVICDPAMQELRLNIERVAPADVNVLLLGETGAGKDVAASMLHALSNRTSKQFICVNCANLPEGLLESELFGHERGAFTGAVAAKAGLLETAHGGTLFLDEVGELTLPLQAKLLRVVESREVTRVGGLHPRGVDVRFVAATNRNLENAVAEGRFRQDLYYRLNCVTLVVPPLRERPLDIEPLATLFLQRACERFQTAPLRFAPATLGALGSHTWPGNIRELRNVIDRAVLLASGKYIEPSHLGLASVAAERASQSGVPKFTMASPANLGDPNETSPTQDDIARALSQCGGNQTRAAKLLGISRRTLVRRLARMCLPRPRCSH